MTADLCTTAPLTTPDAAHTADCPAQAPADERDHRRRIGAGVAALVAAAGLAATGGGVYAALNAVASNTTPQAITSGTLALTLAPTTGSAGFSAPISNLAPTDTVNRYLTLASSGTITGTGLTLAVTDASGTPTRLSTDAVRGLRVAVDACSTGWNTTTGACTGTVTSLLAASPVATLSGTPGVLVPAGTPVPATQSLRVSTGLPDSVETTTNGTVPNPTIQGLSAQLTYTFTEQQRAGTTTNS